MPSLLWADFQQVASGVFCWKNTCNTFVVREGDGAVLIDPGDASVLEHLGEIGVRTVDWILLTGHHRELIQGNAVWERLSVPVAAPEQERELLETPAEFRKWNPRLRDKFSVHGSSYVRPPARALKVERWLGDGAVVEWRGRAIRCVSAPGHSPGGMAYLLGENLFLGGIMYDGARMTNWFDTEWDYGFAKGLDALIESVGKLAALKPALAFSSQGPLIREAASQLQSYLEKLTDFRPDYLRGYPVDNLSKRGPHPATRPTKANSLVQVTPHLFMFGPEMAGKNFAVLIADSGHALLLDCGLFSRPVLERIIADMKEHLGLKQIDACWISHSHGDHFTLFPALKEHGVQFWTMDSIADKCENPRFYDYPAMIGAYNAGFEKAKIDRVLKAGDVIDWEGYKLHIDWMPGQTEFGNALWLEVDGKRVVFTGDNIFGDPQDAKQNGHECVNARNSAIIGEGYLLAAKYLQQIKPDILLGGHSVLMTEPAAFIERYRQWAERTIAKFQALLPDPQYEYQFDPYWVSAYPYRVDLSKENEQTVKITVRNFRAEEQVHRVELRMPPGMVAEPGVLEGRVPPRERRSFEVRVRVTDRAAAGAGVLIAPMDITLDGKKYGELFDFLLLNRPPEPQGAP